MMEHHSSEPEPDETGSEKADTFARDEAFSRLLITNQGRIFGFILALVRDRADARDILQETSIVLWRKLESYQEGTDFGIWAMSVARLCAFEWRRKQKKLPLPMDEQVFELLADEAVAASCDFEERREALRSCLAATPERDLGLLKRSYDLAESVVKIAEVMSRSRIAIYKRLKRIHRDLMTCIEGKLIRESEVER